MAVRRQVTLYLPELLRANVEAIRSRFNPEQAQLIRAHVTLCREDEVADWRQFETRLLQVDRFDVNLTFDEIVRDGNLVCAGVSKSTTSFHRLRNALLTTNTSQPRIHQPHLTLIHPRNGTCDDKTHTEVVRMFKPLTVAFEKLTIIEQVDDGPWRDVMEFPISPVA